LTPFDGVSIKVGVVALGAPASGNPLLDEDGVLAQVGNNGPVFFVAGSILGAPTVRTFTVPAGRPIFFPVINNLLIETPPPECAGSVACALARVSPFIDDATALKATLDGLNLLATGVSGFRQTSSALFSIALPDDNLFGAPKGSYDAVSDGYWVAVEGLSAGPHTLIFGATSGTFLGRRHRQSESSGARDVGLGAAGRSCRDGPSLAVRDWGYCLTAGMCSSRRPRRLEGWHAAVLRRGDRTGRGRHLPFG
jgi:hypothetical protein